MGGWFMLWVILGVLIGTIDWLLATGKLYFTWMWFNAQYNSPLCVASAICLFMAFRTVNIKHNKFINWFAASIFPVYLIHNNHYIISDYLYTFVTKIYNSNTSWLAYTFIFFVSIALILLIPLMDKVRILICNPLENILCIYYYRVKLKLLSSLK